MQGKLEDKEILCFLLNFPGKTYAYKEYAWVMREIRD